MARSRVAVLSSSPETVRDDVRRLLRILRAGSGPARTGDVLVVPDLERRHWFPSCGTTPWQLDGSLEALRERGVPASSVRVIVREAAPSAAARALDTHSLGQVFRSHDVELLRCSPSDPVLPPAAFGEEPLLPELLAALRVPERVCGAQLLLLPALRLHPTFGVSGALATWAQLVLPEMPDLQPPQHAQLLAQLARLLRDLSAGTLVVADATVFGDGAGPATNRPTLQNVLLASTDPVALDAVAARLAGLDLRKLPHLQLCSALGVGRCQPAEIEIVGEEIAGVSFHAHPRRNLANWTEPPHRGALARRTARLVGAMGLDSLYENLLWRPLWGRRWLRRYARTPWGRLFASYRSIGA